MVRLAIRSFLEGDLEAFAALYSPDAVVVAPEGWPESGRFEGRDAFVRQGVRLRESWDSASLEIEREEAAGDWLLVGVRFSAKGVRSGIPLESPVTSVFRVEDGRIAEQRFFWGWDEALDAVGLPKAERPHGGDALTGRRGPD